MSSSENCTTKTRRPRRARRHRAQHHDNQQGGQHGNGSFECGTGGWGSPPLAPPTANLRSTASAPSTERKRAQEAMPVCGGSGSQDWWSGGDPPNPPCGRRGRAGARRSSAHLLGRACARPRICSLGTAHANFGNALGEISELAKGARYFNSYNWNLHTPTPHSLPPQGVLRRRRRGHSGCFFVAPPAPSALRPLLL